MYPITRKGTVSYIFVCKCACVWNRKQQSKNLMEQSIPLEKRDAKPWGKLNECITCCCFLISAVLGSIKNLTFLGWRSQTPAARLQGTPVDIRSPAESISVRKSAWYRPKQQHVRKRSALSTLQLPLTPFSLHNDLFTMETRLVLCSACFCLTWAKKKNIASHISESARGLNNSTESFVI